MSRIRTIKPEFPQSESLGRVSLQARLLFVYLFTISDDHGRSRANSRILASVLFPLDDGADGHARVTGADVEKWLGELEIQGCIRRYTVGDNSYLDIPKWLDHQKIDHPGKPKYPPHPGDKPDNDPKPSRALAKPSETLALEGKGKDRKGNRGERVSTTTTELDTATQAKPKTTEPVVVEKEIIDPKTPVSASKPEQVWEEPEVVAAPSPNRTEPVPEKVNEKPASAKQIIDWDNGDPRNFPEAKVREYAKAIANRLWDVLGASAARERYRTAGASEDIRLAYRWMKEAGFTVAEIINAATHLASTTTTEVTNPIRYMASTVPNLIQRKRQHGNYERPADPKAAAAGRPARPGVEPEESFEARRDRGAREWAMDYLPKWLKNGRRNWPSINAGPEPGTGGSYITPEMILNAEIELGIRND